MRILSINGKPNIDYFTTKGLKLSIDYITIDKVLPLLPAYQVKDSDGSMVDIYQPDVAPFLEQQKYTYDIICFNWNPANYDDKVKHTGGFASPIPLSNGSLWISVRNDGNEQNYFNHEMMHQLCVLINYTRFIGAEPFGRVNDYMDTDSLQRPYYENDYTNPDPMSNFNQTWKQITPYIPLLNKLNSKPMTSTVTITRKYNPTETYGDLVAINGNTTFTCKTLERPNLGNKPNVSCIPEGKYQVLWKFHLGTFGYRYELQSVPGRSGILMHSGNYFTDSLGCILFGSTYQDINKDGVLDIINSRATEQAFEAFMQKKPFTLVIKS